MLYPHYYYVSIFDIPYDKLYGIGMRGLIFDIDNTIACHGEVLPSADAESLINRLSEIGFKVALLSNGSANRVNNFNQKIQLPSVSRAYKPFTKTLKRLMNEMETTQTNTAIIGDQVFADVLCGNFAGITTILTKPLSKNEVFIVRIKRGLERLVLSKYAGGKL